MLNARILFGGTATLAFISFIAAQSHSAAELLSSAFGFLYGILILVSLKEKPTLGRGLRGVVLLGFANWLALFFVFQMNLGFAYSTSPVLLIISLSTIEAVLMVLVLNFTWSFRFNVGRTVRQIVYVMPSALLFLNLLFRAEQVFSSWPDLIAMCAISLWCIGFSFGLVVNDRTLPSGPKN